MSPEQAEARPRALLGPLPATSIASAGPSTPLLSGHPPVTGKDVAEVLANVIRGHFPRPREHARWLDPALEAVCLKAMALKPVDRYATPSALARDVERWIADEPVSAHPEPFVRQARRWARHHKPLVAGASVVLLILPTAIAAIAIIWNQRNLAEFEKLTLQYYSLIEPPPETARTPGWTWDRFSRLGAAAGLNVRQRDHARLRSEVAACLSTVDVREWSPPEPSLFRLEPEPFRGIDIPDPACLAFSPDGRRLAALGQSKTTIPISFQIRVVDRNAGSARTLWCKTGGLVSGITALMRDESGEGARAIAFNPEGISWPWEHDVVGSISGT